MRMMFSLSSLDCQKCQITCIPLCVNCSYDYNCSNKLSE
uniref:Uncharacterized protein n=1 Tax=Rhizophora mucronata TaxID=61149 RepID=A0A2P2PFV4_RHIMU